MISKLLVNGVLFLSVWGLYISHEYATAIGILTLLEQHAVVVMIAATGGDEGAGARNSSTTITARRLKITSTKPITEDSFDLSASENKTRSVPADSLLVQKEHSMHSTDRLEHSKLMLPKYMVKYIDWHAKQRQSLPSVNTNQAYRPDDANNSTRITKYLVVRCLKGDKCGGVSDRLKPLAFYVMLAAHTKRVLLLYWEKPARLEHFLQPPTTSGLDWRVNGTDITLDEIRNKKALVFDGSSRQGCRSMSQCVQNVKDEARWSKQRVINVVLYGGSEITKADKLFDLWNKDKLTVKDRDILGDMFRILFEPNPTVAMAVSKEMKQLGLVEGKFTTVHVRAKSPKQVPKDIFLGGMQQHQRDAAESAGYVDMMGGFLFSGKTKEWILGLFSNAIACAVQLSPGNPIYLASDTTEAVNYMVADPATASSTTIVASNRENDTLHVDYDGNVGRDPSEFYHTFIDLLIMSKAKCMSRGTGGFGMLAERIGGIGNCTVIHRYHSGDTNNCSALLKG